MGNIKEIFQAFDLIGNKVNFSVGDHRKFRTLFGSALSSIVFGILLWVFILQLTDIIQQFNFQESSSSLEEENPQVDLSGKFPFAVAILNSEGALIEIPENYVNFTAYIVRTTYSIDFLGNQKSLISLTPINFGRCDTSNDFNDLSNVESNELISYAQVFIKKSINNNISKYLCIKQKQNLKLLGTPGNNESLSISIFLSICRNSSFRTCSNSTDLQDLLSNTRIHVLSPDYYLNASNHPSPAIFFANSKFHYISINNFQRVEFSYQSVSYETDSGRLFSNIYNQNFYMKREITQTYSSPFKQYFNKDTFAEISINTFPLKIFYKRSFLKYHQMVSFLGGIYTIIMLLVKILNFTVNDFECMLYVYENNLPDLKIAAKPIYKRVVKTNKENSEEELKKDDEFGDINKLKIEFGILKRSYDQLGNAKPSLIQVDKINNYNNFEKHIQIETNKHIKLRFYERNPCCISNKVNKEKLKLSRAFQQHYLNINSLIKVINEFEGIKKLLLDADQVFLFNYYNRSFQNLGNLKEQENVFTTVKERQIKILESVKNLNAKYYKTHIDKWLIDYFLEYQTT